MVIGMVLFFTLCLLYLSFAEESITITTYYPSPYGSYNELTTNILTIKGGAILPGCNESSRGKMFLLQGGSGIEDGFYICKKKADGSYAWIALGSPSVLNETAFGPSDGNVSPPWAPEISFTVPSNATKWGANFVASTWGSNPSISVRISCSPSGLFLTAIALQERCNVGLKVHCRYLVPIQTGSGVPENCTIEARTDSETLGSGSSFISGAYYYTTPQ